jgi:hypothetical protein
MMSDKTRNSSTPSDAGRKSYFSLPPEVRNLIYEYLLLSPLPLPPTPPQSEQHVYTAILRANRRIYLEAIDILYERNFYNIHLRSALHKVAYEPFLSGLTALNASKIKDLEIILWGNYSDDDGDTVSFGTENFCIALRNLIYAPKLVVSIDIINTRPEILEQESAHATTNFCAFDWLISTFVNEWFFNKTCFDLFRAVARFHMKRMFFNHQIESCESRWFSEARATPGLKEHERRRLWDLEERYGLPHEDDEERPSGSENEYVKDDANQSAGGDEEGDKEMESDESEGSEDEGNVTEDSIQNDGGQGTNTNTEGDENGMDARPEDHNNDHGRVLG